MADAAAAGSRSGRSRGGNPAVESAVTRLLVSIKQLLESLTLWSELKATENEVSDVYVRLGNDFNAAVVAFSMHNIDMGNLQDVPEQLRAVLEECLSEEATPANLNRFLPGVREIITNLLHGLRAKQSAYRRVISDGRSSGHGRTESSRSSRSDRTSTSSRVPSGRVQSDNPVRRSGASGGSRISRRKDSVGSSTPTPSTAGSNDAFIGGFAPNLRTTSPPPRDATVSPGFHAQILFQEPYGAYEPAPPSDTTETPRPLPAPSVDPEAPTPSVQRAPANLKRYSLVDRPVSSPPAVVIDAAEQESEALAASARVDAPSPPPSDTPMDTLRQTPAMASSLAALKNDSLERRASKRFSTYTFSKMTGGSLRGPSGNRRSMAASSALTPGELAVLTEAEEADEESASRDEPNRSRSRGPSPFKPPPVPPLPPLASAARTPSPVVSTIPNGATVESEGVDSGATAAPNAPAAPGPVTVFLQVGREVKKAAIDSPAALSLSSLRILFMDKFSYNPGKENFPAIYIRDPSSGIQYQLEDMDEVKDKCLLSLNIEPLDQIKQHIDSQMTALAQDIKDLRTAVASNHRASHPPPFQEQSLADSSPPVPRPSNQQFVNAARRLSRFVAEEDQPAAPAARSPILAQMTGQSIQPQMTGMSVMSEYTSRVVSDLRTQFDEVQNLRRDLGAMRQVYTEFVKQTKESLSGLRTQTQTVRQLAGTKVGGARAYIDTGKTNLDTRSQNVLTRMEELQDTVENIKDDVLKRHITPKPAVIKQIQKDMETVANELSSLSEHIMTIKPMWKKTWEEELHNIVEEQQFLSHQEDFLADLLDDHKAVVEVFGHVEKVISIRGTASVRGRGRGPVFRPPPSEEGGLNHVLLEIRGTDIDHERRMKAITANQRNREKDLQSRSEEFEHELIAQGKKLNKTGGAEEAERVRQRKNDMTIKAMFTGGSVVSVSSNSPGPTSPAPQDGER